MKTLLKVAAGLMLSLVLLQAAAYEKEAKSRTAKVHITSEKPLAVGLNTFQFQITQNGEIPKDAKVTLKAFMPAMPGMPAMKSETEAKDLGNGKYEATVDLSMGGTWQLHIIIMPAAGKKVRIKTSLNL
jgi:hypothetical protein